MTDVTDDSFREIYQNNEIVILDFWAVWCAPCHQFAPTFEAVAEKYPNIFWGKVDTESNQKLPQYFAIRSIPTLLIIRDQIELFRHSGILSEGDLTQVVEQAMAADMNEIEKQVD